MRFPVLVFSKPYILEVVESYDELTICSSRALKNNYYLTSIIIDSELNQFQIESVRESKRINSLWKSLMIGKRLKVDLTFSNAVEKTSIEQIKTKVYQSFENWHGWSSRDDFFSLKEKIKHAQTVSELIQHLRD